MKLNGCKFFNKYAFIYVSSVIKLEEIAACQICNLAKNIK